MAIHRVHQALCILYFSQGMFDQASIQCSSMLAKDSSNPWALQFQADLTFRKLVFRPHSTPTTDTEIGAVSDLYLAAIRSNKGDPNVVQPFLEHLRQLGREVEAV